MAVYTEVAEDQLRGFLAAYGIGELISSTAIAEGVENSNFLIRTTTGRFILTLYERRVRRDDLPFFLGLMEHLSAKGVACPLPLKMEDGTMLRELCDRPAAVVSFLDGAQPRPIDVEHCRRLGEATARLHQAGMDYPRRRPNDLSLAGWHEIIDRVRDTADTLAPDLAHIVEAEWTWLRSLWPENLRQGVIHADLFPDNVFFRGSALTGIIDFYFACTDALAYDLAVCLNAWCFDAAHDFDPAKAQALIDGYQSVRALDTAEIAAFPILVRGAALRFLLTRLYDWLNHPEGALVQRKDPLEYLKKLRFHQAQSSPVAYGLT
jgi:homoserine kinase type II